MRPWDQLLPLYALADNTRPRPDNHHALIAKLEASVAQQECQHLCHALLAHIA